MMDGKDSVLGGAFKRRLQGLANEVLPETVKAKQVAKTSEPGPADTDVIVLVGLRRRYENSGLGVAHALAQESTYVTVWTMPRRE